MTRLSVFYALFLIGAFIEQSFQYGGWHPAPKALGSVWPQPQLHETTLDYGLIQPGTFEFSYESTVTCAIVEQALVKYHGIIFKDRAFRSTKQHLPGDDGNFIDYVSQLSVVVKENECPEWPTLGMDESYNLTVLWNSADLPPAVLTSNTIWGALRGLETFSQLIYKDPLTGQPRVNQTNIVDFPRFSHRGVLLDSARHFLPVNLLFSALDGMAANKFNVLHWHIVDDQSFPFQSVVYPELSQNGAYNPYSHIYTHAEIGSILEHARYLGIRVIPEFDTPGHVGSWGLGIDGILTQCYANVSNEIVPDGYGPLNPIADKTYEVIRNLFTEVAAVFPEQYMHLGGDEVPFDCWQSNPEITDYMATNNITDNYSLLEEVYITRLLDIVANIPGGKSYVVWQEIFDNGVKVKNDTVIHVWKDDGMSELKNVTAAGLKAILSSCWYFDYLHSANDWADFYNCEPLDFDGTDEQKALVMGGEAAMWGEFADSTNVLSKLFPRILTTAEKLWSAASVNSTAEAIPRLEAQRCRLVGRGIPAEPQFGPGFCDEEFNDVLL